MTDAKEKNYEAASKDDKLALEVFRRQGFCFVIALAGLINIFYSETIVIAADLFAPNAIKEIDKRAYGDAAKRVKIVRAGLGDDAEIRGAAGLAFDRILSSTI